MSVFSFTLPGTFMEHSLWRTDLFNTQATPYVLFVSDPGDSCMVCVLGTKLIFFRQVERGGKGVKEFYCDLFVFLFVH